jgi:hypothetical protein
MRPRPSTLVDVCTFNRSGRALVHRWGPPEPWGYLGRTTETTLRVTVRRCLRCQAFVMRSHGGDEDWLATILEDARPIPHVSAWISHEQPGHENVALILPRRKRRKRTGYGRKEAA